MLWSETLFILLSLLFFVAFTKYLNSHTLRSLMGAAVIAAFAFVTRYAGITLLLTGGFLLLFDGRLVIKKKTTPPGYFRTSGYFVNRSEYYSQSGCFKKRRRC